ncbi:Alpha-N-acetylgalactosaminidase [Trichinella sp. T8]|nr:Alpha-N-acetylgalactosaminidase [Trichinella sp. T8]
MASREGKMNCPLLQAFTNNYHVGGKKKPLKQPKKTVKELTDDDMEMKKKQLEEKKALKIAAQKAASKGPLSVQKVAPELSIFLRFMSETCAIFVALVSILFENALRSFGAQNGLALTPPMGWISWLQFGCQIDCSKGLKNCFSEQAILDIAEHLVADGYRDAGYIYMNLDDCWSSHRRDQNGRLMADPIRFPHGIKWLGQELHRRGLKLGMYTNIGSKTCMGYPGSGENIEKDAETFASWEVDMLKVDGCFTDKSTFSTKYPKMAKALNFTGRKILLSCSWPYYTYPEKPPYPLIAKHCNMWRNYQDVQMNWNSIMQIIDFYEANQDLLANFHKRGQWNDADMLVIGSPKLTNDQAQAQMAIWSILGVPLFMSNDLRTLSPALQDILLNEQLIAINKDPLQPMGKVVKKASFATTFLYMVGSISIYKKEVDIRSPFIVLVLFNRDEVARKMIEIKMDLFSTYNKRTYLIHDVLNKNAVGYLTQNANYGRSKFEFHVPPTGVVVLKVYPVDVDLNAPPTTVHPFIWTIFGLFLAISVLKCVWRITANIAHTLRYKGFCCFSFS